jgi:archaeosortase A (PGF-CTERM-specific)
MMGAPDLLNLVGLLLLGAGFLWRDRRAHPVRMLGWLLEGVFWGARAFHYLDIDDQFNAFGAALALPIFWYLAFHEAKSYQWSDDYPPLRFVAGAMFIAGLGYFIIGHFPPVSEFLIGVTAEQSVWLANIGGYSFAVGEVSADRAILVGVPIMIVIECTAVQAYLVAGSFLFGCRGDGRKRAPVFIVIAAIVWLVNLFRNAIVIMLVHDRGIEYFDFAHNVLGKGMSLAALILLVLMAFMLVPELYEDINGLFELPWRRGPKHDYLRFVGRLYGDREGSPPGKA